MIDPFDSYTYSYRDCRTGSILNDIQKTEVFSVAKNPDIFEDFLNEKEALFESYDLDGKTVFKFNQKLEQGPRGRILAVFDEDDGLVSIYAYDYLSLTDDAKKDSMYKLLNNLNLKYTYVKFYMDEDNDITLSSYTLVENNFSPEVIFKMIIGVFNVLEEQYAAFMKIMWS